MLAHTIFFYFFSIITVGSALMVIASKNTVHAVFFLILDFISVGCLFIMIGAEFLGMIMLIVYVGAVAVLFLFVVMMLNVAEQKQSWFRGLTKSTHIPVGLIVSIIILLEVLVVIGGWKYKANFISTDSITIDSNFSNTHQLGSILYTDYIYLFQIAGIILLLSMIGAIVLTYRKREGVKKQSYINQISRERKTSIEIVEVDSNIGVKIDD
ncbi:NADH-quinone oxidoreductase subunit J [Pelagibacteraceae bacterium]|nr:NADH-quinone oxidoreductase subunit J [Pelagibacteraceae bacterium]